MGKHKREQPCASGSRNNNAQMGVATQARTSTKVKKKHNLQITNHAKQSKKPKLNFKITQNIRRLKNRKETRTFESKREHKLI
jgi:hypothetical protein